MSRSQKIAVVISGLVVVGLVALAAPVFASASSALSSWAPLRTAEQPPTAAADADGEADTEAGDVAATEDVDSGDGDHDGLISAGNGTWFSAQGPGNCTTNAAIHPYGPHDPNARLGGELVDMGVSDYASGEVGYNAEGLIETYTVASGDTLVAIGERFCIDYVTVGAYNDRFGTEVIQPGDVLVLRP
jgi:hypothetical protein